MPQGTSGAHHSRRTVLAGCALVAVGTLTGCDVRVERDAPHIPGVPTQSPPPDSKLLLATLRQVRTLAATAESAGRTTGPSPSSSGGTAAKTSVGDHASAAQKAVWATQLATIHHQQALRLAGIIATMGATAGRTSSATRSTTAPTSPATPSRTVSRLRALERKGVQPNALEHITPATKANLPMLCAIAAVQGAAATVLGATLTWPTSLRLPRDEAVPLLRSVRSCVYALEVIAGRTPLKQRTLVSTTLTTMYAARSRLVATAGSSAPPPQVDYQLPVQVTDTASERRLAQIMLGRVITACASQSPAATSHPSQISSVVRLWSEATAASWQWGAKPSPFPGLDA